MADNLSVLNSAGATTIIRATDQGNGTLVMMSIPSSIGGTSLVGAGTIATSIAVNLPSDQIVSTNLARVGGAAIALGAAASAAAIPVVFATNQSNLPVNLASVGAAAIALGQAASAASIPVVLPSNQIVSANISQVGGATLALGAAASAASVPVVFATNQSNLPVNLASVGAAAIALGQAASAASIPVVLPSNQVVSANISLVGGAAIALGAAASAASVPVVFATNQASIPISITIASLARITSTTGTPAAVSIKASAGTCWSINLWNNATASRFVKFYNSTVAAIASTLAPALTVGVSPGAQRDMTFPGGVAFTNAWSYWVTGLIVDNDTTAVAANDITGGVTFV